MHPKTLVVFSHLRWNFVFQRPQHLLSRLAAHYRVIFIEEPIHDGGDDVDTDDAVVPDRKGRSMRRAPVQPEPNRGVR